LQFTGVWKKNKLIPSCIPTATDLVKSLLKISESITPIGCYYSGIAIVISILITIYDLIKSYPN